MMTPEIKASSTPPAVDPFAQVARDLLRQGRGGEALAAWCRTLEIDPDFAPGFHGAGLALELIGDEPGALASWRHAADIASTLAGPRGALALAALRERRPTEARLFAEAALACDPGDPSARAVLGRMALDGRDPAAALAWLEPAVRRGSETPQRQAMAERLMADALDALGRKDEAFDLYAAAAGGLRRLHARACGGPSPLSGLDLCQALADGYSRAPDALWRPAPGSGSGGEAGHVFVVGFPRSGTTLLEQVLAGHPEVAALEERPTLLPAIERYLDPPEDLGALAEMDETTAEALRQEYWARVRGFGVEPAGKVFVDKQPFYTLWLPLIVKLFPDAKLVIPRRDPRDVVLSCFRRPFRITPLTWEFLDLERGAQVFDAAMRILDIVMERSALPAFDYRHEDLIEDFDGVAGALCRFLDLAWDDRVRDFAATARRRLVCTPSAPQVVRGLNRDGVGAWRAYAGHIDAMLPILEPRARRLGYAP
jgi:tetratricopeptide (TPR) repeat protein